MSEHVFREMIDGAEQTYTAPKAEWDFYHTSVPDMMENHLGGELGLRLLPYHPIKHPYQRFDVSHYNVSPAANLGIVRALADKVLGERRTDEYIEAYRSRTDLADARRMDMGKGLRTGLLTNHGIIYDVAVAHGLDLLAIGEERFISRGALIMSKAITGLEVDTGVFGTMPAPDALSFIVSSFYSIPKTKSSYAAVKHPGVARSINPRMLQELNSRLQHDISHLTVAGSGSTDKEKDGVITMQRLGTGTARLLSRLDRILPIALNITAATGEPWFKIGRYTDIAAGNPEQAHTIMEQIALDLAGITGKTVHYDDKHFHETDEPGHAKEKLIETAHHAGEVAHDAGEKVVKQVGRMIREFQERRNRRWDKLHDDK